MKWSETRPLTMRTAPIFDVHLTPTLVGTPLSPGIDLQQVYTRSTVQYWTPEQHRHTILLQLDLSPFDSKY